MKEELVAGSIGTTLGVFGTATQTNEILQTISLIITIIGAVITYIVVPVITWYLRAKKDKKITPDEIKEGVEIISKGTEEVNEEIKKGK